uniref:Putative secreted protein n=1 Tax=Ixodes ricinus TaxID=34613 RepID=A0A6B0U1A4_IXORI
MGRPMPFILLTVIAVLGIILLQGAEASMCGTICWGPSKCKGRCSQCTYYNSHRPYGTCQIPLKNPAPSK